VILETASSADGSGITELTDRLLGHVKAPNRSRHFADPCGRFDAREVVDFRPLIGR